jgi:hypothetical protein
MRETNQQNLTATEVVAATADEPTNNRYNADALERVSRVRAIVADLPGAADLPRLSSSDLRIANSTSAEALEQAAVMAVTAQGVGGELANAAAFRDAVNYIFAYQQLREEMTAALRKLDLAIVRNKLTAVKLARPFYQLMKVYASTEVGDPLKPYVTQMQRTLARRRRKPANSTAPSEPTAPAEVSKQ